MGLNRSSRSSSPAGSLFLSEKTSGTRSSSSAGGQGALVQPQGCCMAELPQAPTAPQAQLPPSPSSSLLLRLSECCRKGSLVLSKQKLGTAANILNPGAAGVSCKLE